MLELVMISAKDLHDYFPAATFNIKNVPHDDTEVLVQSQLKNIFMKGY